MAAYKLSETADHAMRLLPLTFLKNLHSLFENSVLFALKDTKLSE